MLLDFAADGTCIYVSLSLKNLHIVVVIHHTTVYEPSSNFRYAWDHNLL